jgi:hypothetical protein
MTRPTPGIILIVTLLFVLVNVAVAADTVAITARQTVVRAGPDSKQRILASVQQGTTLAILKTRQGWYKVLLDDGQEGWVAQSAAQVQDGRGLAVVPVGAAAAPGRTALVIGNEVLARMDAAGQGKSLNVMILDACRNAPFMRGWRSPLRGLAPMQATGGSLGSLCYLAGRGSARRHGPQWYLHSASVALHDGTESPRRADVQAGAVGGRAGDERAADPVGAVIPAGE